MASQKKIKVKDLVPDDQNFNKGNEFGESLIEKSFSKFGAGRSILLDKNNRIIAGNKSTQKFVEQGGENVILVETDGKTLVAVKRTDVDLDTKRGREMALADNASAKANITWDVGNLAEWDLPLDDWGVDVEFDAEPVEEDEAAAADAINKAAELQKKWGTEPNQLWALGNHRLLCGDSTNAQVVERLLGGAKPNLMVTDPPYGVEYDAEWRQAAGIEGCENNSIGKVENDDRIDWSAAYELFPGKVFYCWHAGRYAGAVQASIEISGFEIRSQIIWVKEQGVISRGHYNWQHEPCWYAFRTGETANWIGDNTQTTVWRINKANRSDTGHSTQKPLECMARPIRNHEGDVYDPFLGSGTTLIACEQLGRKCYAVEISEAYVAVALERFYNLTGVMPELIEADEIATTGGTHTNGKAKIVRR